MCIYSLHGIFLKGGKIQPPPPPPPPSRKKPGMRMIHANRIKKKTKNNLAMVMFFGQHLAKYVVFIWKRCVYLQLHTHLCADVNSRRGAAE